MEIHAISNPLPLSDQTVRTTAFGRDGQQSTSGLLPDILRPVDKEISGDRSLHKISGNGGELYQNIIAGDLDAARSSRSRLSQSPRPTIGGFCGRSDSSSRLRQPPVRDPHALLASEPLIHTASQPPGSVNWLKDICAKPASGHTIVLRLIHLKQLPLIVNKGC